MTAIGPIGFAVPWMLWGLLLLPVLWLLLRAVPPAPKRRRFPGVVFLLGLADKESQSDKTPWWLLLLRMLVVACVIIGLAGPVLNPQVRQDRDGPLLILTDGSWADARDWSVRQNRIAALLEEAQLAARPVRVMTLTRPDAEPPVFQSANDWLHRAAGMTPNPWSPDGDAVREWSDALGDQAFDTFWLSDGVDYDWRMDLLATLKTHGAVSVYQSANSVLGLRPPKLEQGQVALGLIRTEPNADLQRHVEAVGRDPSGQERILARTLVTLSAGEIETTAVFDLPPELLGRVSRFAVASERSAGAVALTDDSLQRREVALIAGRASQEGLQLLSPLHYLNKALLPTVDLLEGTLTDILPANPDVIIFADVATLPETQSRSVAEWVAKGGTLLRFAGPRLAGSDLSRDQEDPLMPVRLRRGGRSVGGTLSWGAPKTLQPFLEDSPFYGLAVPDDVLVTSQVMAQPDPALAERTIAALADGTPLVTRKRLGEGQVVLFHVTANAEWSSLPLSGLFVDMLERLAVSGRQIERSAETMAETVWSADMVMDAFGQLSDTESIAGIAGEDLAAGMPSDEMPPGIYVSAGRRDAVALNVISGNTALLAQGWPADIPVEGLGVEREIRLKGWVVAIALGLLALDTLASLWLAGRLLLVRTKSVVQSLGIIGLIGLLSLTGGKTVAQEDEARALQLSQELALAYVQTGNSDVDQVAAAGLRGLSRVLTRRTSVEPSEPVAIDLERDDLTLLPFLYWPVTDTQPIPSDLAYARLNAYLQSGGMILFDTRDAGYGGGNSPEARHLQSLAAALDIPPLEQVPPDHVLTRTFYLLQDFPGRFQGQSIWVEASSADAEQIEGMPFRNLNDGVTPVVIGGNDWAAAWAIDDGGNSLFPVGRGYSGERQREVAYRFGVNLIMHVLTGNYKSDQVHVPALLDRLGQ